MNKNTPAMTSRERVTAAMNLEPVARLPVCDSLWDGPQQEWIQEAIFASRLNIFEACYNALQLPGFSPETDFRGHAPQHFSAARRPSCYFHPTVAKPRFGHS